MTRALETVRVVSTDPASQGPFVIINATDFDGRAHQIFEDHEPEAETHPAMIKRGPGRPRKTQTEATNGDR